MDNGLSACKKRMVRTLGRMAEEYEQLAIEAEYLNRRFEPPVDVEEFRVLAHAAREALRAVREDRPIEPRWQELLGLNDG